LVLSLPIDASVHGERWKFVVVSLVALFSQSAIADDHVRRGLRMRCRSHSSAQKRSPDPDVTRRDAG